MKNLAIKKYHVEYLFLVRGEVVANGWTNYECYELTSDMINNFKEEILQINGVNPEGVFVSASFVLVDR